MTVWGGETPGVQITLPTVVMTLAPIFLVNAVVILAFHWRYRLSYKRRLAARLSPFPGAYGAPVPAGSTPLATTAEAKSSE